MGIADASIKHARGLVLTLLAPFREAQLYNINSSFYSHCGLVMVDQVIRDLRHCRCLPDQSHSCSPVVVFYRVTKNTRLITALRYKKCHLQKRTVIFSRNLIYLIYCPLKLSDANKIN